MTGTRKTGTAISKVVYKPDHTRSDEYIVIVHPEEYKKWKEAFDVFHSTQGAQGLLGRPSKQQLENDFGSSRDDEVVAAILEKGKEETSGGIATGTVATNLSKGSFAVDTKGKSLTGIH
ncbi:DUF1960-domain-containing protein [Panus rudis PR-1116 ss-1]|nr:DUF1960-domain-containing protein [Panus rudis PR-1116 ss-1]